MNNYKIKISAVCFIAAMSLLCLSLAPSSKVKDIVGILHELSLADGQAVSDAKNEVMIAQDAETKGKKTKAGRAYAKAARSLIEALKNNRIKCTEAQRNYQAVMSEITKKRATSTELKPIFMRMLKLDGEYIQLYALLEDVSKKVPKGRVKIPTAVTDFTGFDALRSEIDRVREKVREESKKGENGLAGLRAKKDKMVARYKGVVSVLDGHQDDMQGFELIVRTDNGGRFYSISLKDKIVRAQSILGKLRHRISEIDAKLSQIPAVQHGNLKKISGIRGVPENLSSLIILRRKAENISKLVEKGGLSRLIKKLKQDKAHESVLDDIDDRMTELSSSLSDLLRKADKYSGTLANIEDAKSEMDERAILENLENRINVLNNEYSVSVRRIGDISGEIYVVLNRPRPDVDTLIALYDQLTSERAGLRKIVADISKEARQEITIDSLERTTVAEITYLKDLMKQRSYLRRSIDESNNSARSVALKWEERMNRIVREAIEESLDDTDYKPLLDDRIRDLRKSPVDIDDYLEEYEEIFKEVNAFLEKAPVMVEKINTLKKEYEAIDEKARSINDLLKEVDVNIVEVQTTNLLRGKARKLLESRRKIRKRLDELERSRLGNLNDQLRIIVEDPDADVSVLQAYNELESDVYDLWDSAVLPLNKWKPLKSVVTDVEVKLLTLKKNISEIKRLMNIPIIKARALKEEPPIQAVLDGSYLNRTFGDWTVFLNWIQPQLKDDEITELDHEWTNRSREVEKDVDEKVAYLNSLLKLYKPMDQLLGEQLAVERKDKRGRSTRKGLKVKELIGQSEAIAKKVNSARNVVYSLKDSLDAIKPPNKDIESEKQSLMLYARLYLRTKQISN